MNNNIISHKKSKIPTPKLSRYSNLTNEQYLTERKTQRNIISTSTKKRNNNSKTNNNITFNSKPVRSKSKIYSRDKSAEISHRQNKKYKIEANKKIKISTAKKETKDYELKNLIINAEKHISDKIDNGINKISTSINNVGLILYYGIETLISCLKNDKNKLEKSLNNFQQQSANLKKKDESENIFEISQSNNDGNIQINKINLNKYSNSNNNINITKADIDSDKKGEKISFELNKKEHENDINLNKDIIKQQENSNNSSSKKYSIHMVDENNSKEKKSGENSSDQVDTSKKKILLRVGKVIQTKKESKKYLKIVSKKSAVHLILAQKKMLVNMELKK